MKTPNYQSRSTSDPFFAFQILNTDESIAMLQAIFPEFEAPDRTRLCGVSREGERYTLGSWVTICQCEGCEGGNDESIMLWNEEEFIDAFEAIDNVVDPSIANVKQLRRSLDAILQEMKITGHTRERSLAITKIQEGIMWLGMELKALGTPSPYPSSYDPSSPVVEPTADGLKL